MKLDQAYPPLRRGGSGYAKPKDQFLSAVLYTSGPVVRSLRVAADLLGYPTADALATEWLRARLDQEPGVAELETEIARAIQRAKEGRAAA